MNRVVRAELPRLYRVASRLCASPSEAEDLVAQTLMQAAAGWKAFDGRFPAAWLFRIMNNCYLQRVRSEPDRPIALGAVPEAPSSDDIHREVEGRWTLEEILSALERLSPEHRMAITLCDIEGMSYEEAAEALGVPSGTLCSRLFRARKALQMECLGTLGEGL